MKESRRVDAGQRGGAKPLLILVVLVALVAAGLGFWLLRARPEPTAPPPATLPPPPPPTTAPPVTTVPATPAPPMAAAPTTVAPAPVATPDPEAAAAFARSFVAGKTRAEASAMPPGFMPADRRSPAIKVERASGVLVKLAFEVEPPHVRPGDPYRIRILLDNAGTRPLRAASLKVEFHRDGEPSEESVPVASDPMAPGQSRLLAELPGTWPAGVRQWSLAVRVTTVGGDVYRNDLTWH